MGGLPTLDFHFGYLIRIKLIGGRVGKHAPHLFLPQSQGFAHRGLGGVFHQCCRPVTLVPAAFFPTISTVVNVGRADKAERHPDNARPCCYCNHVGGSAAGGGLLLGYAAIHAVPADPWGCFQVGVCDCISSSPVGCHVVVPASFPVLSVA